MHTAVLLSALSNSTLLGAPLVFTDKAEWMSAVSGFVATEAFDEVASHNPVQVPHVTESGLRLTRVPADTSAVIAQILKHPAYPESAALHFRAFENHAVSISMPGEVVALGFEHHTLDRTWRVQVPGIEFILPEADWQTGSTFIGFVFSSAMSSDITFANSSYVQHGLTVDNVMFANAPAAVPEPSTVSVMLLSSIFLFTARARRIVSR
jgi:hypothetical protein